MRRLLAMVAGICALALLVGTHSGVFAQGQEKTLICHSAGDNAHIIEVAAPAVPKHLENHGDCIINSTNRDLIGAPCDTTDANFNDICDIQP